MLKNETLRLISARRSHRAYQATQLTEEQLETLLAAGVQAPSAVNRQPWHFTVVQNRAFFDQMNGEIRAAVMRRDQTQRSPRFEDKAFDVFYHAPTVIFLSAPQDAYWAPVDCGIAVQNIVLAAESLNLGTVILGMPRDAFSGARAAEFSRRLLFPEGYRFIIAVAVGIPSDDKAAHPVGADKISFVR